MSDGLHTVQLIEFDASYTPGDLGRIHQVMMDEVRKIKAEKGQTVWKGPRVSTTKFDPSVNPDPGDVLTQLKLPPEVEAYVRAAQQKSRDQAEEQTCPPKPETG